MKTAEREETLKDRLQAFYESLCEEGLIVEPNHPITDGSPYKNHRLVEVNGKPLSQEIIEAHR